MSVRPKWKRLLEPYARLYAETMETLADRLKAMSDAEFAELETAIAQPTQTNVWWATYEVAQIMDAAVRDERRRRRHVVADPEPNEQVS